MAKLDLNRIEEAVGKFLLKAGDAPFSKTEALEFLKGSFKKLKPKELEALEREAELCLDSQTDIFADRERETFQSRNGFFKGALFRVVPTRLELSNGILIAGGRFAPFCHPDSFPETMSLFQKEGGPAVPVVSFSVPFEQISDLHILLGREGVLDYLIAESEENYSALSGGASLNKAVISVDVFEMRSFCKESGFREGDALIFEVKDWSGGAFKFHREPAGSRSEKERTEWISGLERALISVYDECNDYIEIPEQLAQAFFKDACGGGRLLKDPAVGLDEYPRMMRELAIRHSGSDWLIVPLDCLDEPGSGDAEEEGGISPGDFSISSGKLDSLESLLADIKSPVQGIELQAMVFDEIANGCESFEDFRKRVLEPFSLPFADDAQEACFLNFVEDIWESSTEKFSHTVDGPKAPLRARLLELTSRRIEVFEALLKDAGGLSSKMRMDESLAAELKNCHASILATLSMLNVDAFLPEGGEYEDLEMRVGDIEERWDSLMERVSAP